MPFPCIPLKILSLRLPPSTSGGPQPPSQVFSVLMARFFTSSSSSGSTGSTGSSSSADYSSSRCFQRVQESRDVGVSVWWDFSDCKIPARADALKVVRAITAAIRSSGIEGPIEMTAFGDVTQLSANNWNALSSTKDMMLVHVPRAALMTPRRALSISLVASAVCNKPPAHHLVISSDRILARTLHNLRMCNYNILLVTKGCAPGVLRGAATIMWDWRSLVTGGGNVTGRHFNQPPDVHLYGYYMIPLQDPVAALKQSKSMKTAESLASNSNLNSKASAALPKTPLWLDSSHGPSTPSNRRVGENETDKSKGPGFFDRILKWFKNRKIIRKIKNEEERR